MNLASLDLNLLLAFEALAEERSVTRAAKRVGLSQPAMSNALARLRAALGDPLFVRAARGIQPTPRAQQLAGPVRAALAQLRAALDQKPAFDPASSSRSFTIATTDYGEFLLMGPLARLVSAEAAGVTLVVRRLERIFVPPEQELQAGALDAAIGFFPDSTALRPDTYARALAEERNVCIARRGHPRIRQRLTLEQYAAAGHAGIFYASEGPGLVDNLLAARNLRRRLVVQAPHFVTVPYIVAASDLVATLPERLALAFRRHLPLSVFNLPLPLPTFTLRLVWHQRTHDDPAHQWLRDALARSLHV